jgi:hypothetical protein
MYKFRDVEQNSVLGRWVAKLVLVAPACYGSALGSNPDISKNLSKIQNVRRLQRSGQHTLAALKI